MKSFFVGIAGGTGAGKSTVCFALTDEYPNKIGIVHLDDYHKKREEVPKLFGMTNWDCPEAINFRQLLSDIQVLRNGESVTVQTKNERFNPKYKKVGRIPMKISPKQVMLIEGYLALWNDDIRALLDYKIYFDLDYETRIKRRTKFMDATYQERILIPMHQQYVEITKQYADHIIDVSNLTSEQVTKRAKKIIRPLLQEL